MDAQLLLNSEHLVDLRTSEFTNSSAGVSLGGSMSGRSMSRSMSELSFTRSRSTTMRRSVQTRHDQHQAFFAMIEDAQRPLFPHTATVSYVLRGRTRTRLETARTYPLFGNLVELMHDFVTYPERINTRVVPDATKLREDYRSTLRLMAERRHQLHMT